MNILLDEPNRPRQRQTYVEELQKDYESEEKIG
jgi:hypothetical protein